MTPERELLWLRSVRDVCHLLAVECDSKRLLPLILDAAIELTNAKRGFLVLLLEDSGKLKVEEARGFDSVSLRGPEGSVSRTVVQRVIRRGFGLVTSEDGDRDILEVSSVRARQVLSILAVPLRLRGACIGVLYLDHRFTRDVFSPADLPILQAFADHAALALETAALSERSEGQEAAPALPPPREIPRSGRRERGHAVPLSSDQRLSPAVGTLFSSLANLAAVRSLRREPFTSRAIAACDRS